MKVGICEDYDKDRDVLAGILTSILLEHEILECHEHGAAFIESHNERPFDIAFLDIGLPNLNGISVAKEMRSSSDRTHIIFLSQYRDYAAESYAVKAFSYLNKPISKTKVIEVFGQARNHWLNRSASFAITTNYETVYLLISNIIYAETLRNKIRIHTCAEIFDTRMTMQELMAQLGQHGFCRIHSSYSVNLNYVRAISKKTILLDNGVELPVGKTKKISEIKASIRFWREM